MRVGGWKGRGDRRMRVRGGKERRWGGCKWIGRKGVRERKSILLVCVRSSFIAFSCIMCSKSYWW